MPLSDETLAAYLDGNATAAETEQVLSALAADTELRQLMTIALNIDTPSLRSEQADVLPMLKMAALSNENICGVQCEAYVMQRRGLTVDSDSLLATARKAGWLRPQGMPLHAMGQLLASQQLMVSRQYDATVNDIEDALKLDNDVICAVDCEKLYPGRPDPDDEPNHAVVVTAVSPDHENVTLYDPAEPQQVVVALPLFLSAWHESSNYMVRVLQTIDDYTPQPVQLSDVTLTGDLLELREAIAENAHDVWAAARISQGWIYGPERDDHSLHHPDIVPYCSLPDSEKEYDRIMALDTIKLVQKLGFDIVRRL